ncbi:MAG: Do family serine endopeptidase [Campylobacterales bacterium]
MKKAIIALTTVAVLVVAGTLHFKDSGSSPQLRQMPANAGAIISYYDAIKEAKKCVVNISTQKIIKGRQFVHPFMNDPFFREFFGDAFGQMVPKDRVERSLGSGVVITEDGYIVTNNHVIDGADKILISFSDGKKEYEAKLIGADPKSDLAVVKIDAGKLTPIAFSDSSTLREGDVVFAIGNPFGVGETITHGIISALNKSGLGINDYENYIQTDAPINPGNSGGALVDSRGGLVGINTAILSRSGGNHGIGFAIPSNSVKRVVESLISKGRVERGYLGVAIGDLTKDLQEYYKRSEGAVVMDVTKDSPAARAGVLRGDLIIAMNGKAILGANDLRNRVGDSAPGSTVTLDVIRGAKKLTINVKLDKMPESGEALGSYSGIFEGLSVTPATDSLRKKYGLPATANGLIVDGVKEGSPAENAGFMVGDLIFQVEETEISSIVDFEKAFNATKGPKRIFIQRGGRVLILVVK